MTSISSFFSNGAAARISALLAGLGVALGAFGAHGLKDILNAHPNGAENWRTAVLYHLIHATVMFALSFQGARVNRAAWWCFLIGVFGFSGSLYLLATTEWKSFLWPVTPLGGLFFLVGWTLLVIRPFGNKS